MTARGMTSWRSNLVSDDNIGVKELDCYEIQECGLFKG